MVLRVLDARLVVVRVEARDEPERHGGGLDRLNPHLVLVGLVRLVSHVSSPNSSPSTAKACSGSVGQLGNLTVARSTSAITCWAPAVQHANSLAVARAHMGMRMACPRRCLRMLGIFAPHERSLAGRYRVAIPASPMTTVPSQSPSRPTGASRGSADTAGAPSCWLIDDTHHATSLTFALPLRALGVSSSPTRLAMPARMVLTSLSTSLSPTVMKG